MDPVKAERHRQFVGGLTGGTVVEIFGLILILCPVIYLRLNCEMCFFRNFSRSKLLILDTFCILVAIVLPCTILSNYVLEINVLLFSTVVLFKLKAPMNQPRIPLCNGFVAWRRLIRFCTLTFTCVCIFAVDLPIFPRRFAKTEVSGVSLMDVGVGMIVVTIGLSHVVFLDVAQTNSRGRLISIMAKATIPLLFMGVIRLVVVKCLGYPEHETEYGLHWNFFFTLAVVRFGGFLSACILPTMNDFDSMVAHFALCVSLAFIQQWIVLPISGHAFPHLVSPENSTSYPSRRGNFDIRWLIQANAEGIVSLPGYLCLFFYGGALGIALRLHLEPPKETGQSEAKLKCICRQGEEDWYGDPKRISIAVFCLSIPMFLIVEAYGESNVSRRLVNLPYIALQIGLLAPPMSFFVYQLFTMPISKTHGRKDLLPLTSSIADHGIMYFIVSNLATGTLNLLFDTLIFVNMQPMWLSAVYQLLLLSSYTAFCPFLAATLSFLLFGRRITKQSI